MKRRLAVIGIMVVAALALAGCLGPLTPIVDPDDPVVPVVPVLTIPVAAFDYYCVVDPIQTDSVVIFHGSDSYDPDGEIVWGKWDFGDGEEIEGSWEPEGLWVWENDERQWVTIPFTGTETVWYVYADARSYTVTLTVWDGDGNEASTTRKVRVY